MKTSFSVAIVTEVFNSFLVFLECPSAEENHATKEGNHPGVDLFVQTYPHEAGRGFKDDLRF